MTTTRTIAILHQKGGVGKTTLALNLAAEAQARGLRALVVDSDPQRTTKTWREFRGDTDLPVLPIVELSSEFINKELPAISAGYDRVFIDTSAGINKRSIAAVKVSNLVLVPTAPAPADLWSCEGLFRMIEDAQMNSDMAKPCFVVYNLTQSNARNLAIVRDVQEQIESGFGVNFLSTPIIRRTAWQSVMWRGRTILEGRGKDHDPKAIGDLRAVYDEIDEVFAALEDQQARATTHS